MSEKPFIVACIPAFDEERTIARVVIKAMKHVSKVIVVDDGSTDMTGEIAEMLGAVVIRNDHKGKGSALRTALSCAKRFNPSVVVSLDADAQHDPDEIPSLIKPIIEDEADMVVGSRYLTESNSDAPLYRRVGLRLVNVLSRKSCDEAVKDTQCGFRAYSIEALGIIQQCEAMGYGIEVEQLAVAVKNGLRILEVPVMVKYKGLARTSKRNPIKHGSELIGAALRLIVEERPLLFLGLPGALLVMLGISTGIYLLWYFNMKMYFSIPMALITLGALFTGTLLSITSIMLYAMIRLRNKK